MKIRILLCAIACCYFGGAHGNEQINHFTLYLVRHAEKQASDSHDPELSIAGEQRAQLLAAWFEDKHIQDIWSSDYLRTRNTAMPMVNSYGVTLRIYDPRDLAVLTDELLDGKRNAVVIGHSNTTPELARMLCHCEIDDMDEPEYDRLIVISVVDGETRVTTLQQRQLFDSF